MRKEIKHEITQDLILSLFECDFVLGKMTWRKPTKYHPRLLGSEAGTPQENHSGKLYWVIRIYGKGHKRGRLLFLARHGRFPVPCVDHEDGNSLNDSIENLREATVLENAWNHKKRRKSSDLPMGVRQIGNRFQVRLAIRGKMNHFGCYDTIAEAHKVYLEKRRENYGDYCGL